MYPELIPKVDTPEADKSRMYNTAPVAQYRNKVRKGESDGKQQMWPLWLEDIFFDALLLIPPIGQTRINTGLQPPIMNGRNTLIAKYLSMHGWTPTLPRCTTPLWRIEEKRDSERARKQVSSHCQVLKAFYSTLVTSHFLFHAHQGVLQQEKAFSNVDNNIKSLESYEILIAIANGRLPDKQPNYDYFSKLLNANEDVFLRPKQFRMFISSSNRGESVTLGNGTIKTHAPSLMSNNLSLGEMADSCPNFSYDNKNSEKVLHAGNSPFRILHEYSGELSQTESSSVGAISRKWAKHFPRLREKLIAAHNDTQPSDTETSRCVVGPCDTLHLVVTLDLETGSQGLEMSELNCIVELSINRSALYNHSWRTITSVIKPDELCLSRSEPEVWDQNELAEAYHAGCTSDRPCRCTQHSIHIPFPVDTWAAILMKLAPYTMADCDSEENRLGSRSSRRQAQSRKMGGADGDTRNAAELLSEVAMYQEIWSAPNTDSCVPSLVSQRSWTRRAVMLWTFSPVRKRRDESPEPPGTTWRFLTKLDPFSRYHQQHAYVKRPSTTWPDTSMLLDQDMSYGYATVDDGLHGSSVAAQVPYEWPPVSSHGFTDQLSTASQYNRYIGSFDHVNAMNNSRTDNLLNGSLYPMVDYTSCTGSQMQIPGPSDVLGTAFTNPCLFDGVPAEVNESRHLLDIIPSNGNTPEKEIQEMKVPGTNPNNVPMLWNDAYQNYLQEGPAQQYDAPRPDSLWNTEYMDNKARMGGFESVTNEGAERFIEHKWYKDNI
ncbi:hypothetical protein GGR55DRAFT_672311 [Xylaria sp. FL0064]|nr:hypothetical protein GGR55DRAFT_672311 [Xylaria sp. FL0064]